MTYLKELRDKEGDIAVISFEGDVLDIYELRDYAKMINSVKGKTEDKHYREFNKQDNVVEIDIDDFADHAMWIANYLINEEEAKENIVEENEPEEDIVNHPSHYTDGNGMECIDEMILVFGKEATAHFCLLNCWKYRHRAVYKNGIEDKHKSDWYMAKYKELKEEIENEKKSLKDWCTVNTVY